MDVARGRLHLLAVLLGVATVLSVLTIGIVPVASAGSDEPQSTDGKTDIATAFDLPLFQEDDEDVENETVRHQNPDEYDGSSDPEGLRGWLGDILATRLQDSTVALSDGQAELAREHVDEEYREFASQYAEISSETGDDDEGDVFHEAGDDQEQLVETMAEYQEVREAYDDARQEGNDLEARQLARQLQELADELEESSERVDEHYDEIEESTGRDVSESQEQVRELNQSVQEDQEAITAQQFSETELTLSIEEQTISYLNPLNATGELRTADGRAVTNEEIRLDVGGYTEYTETDDSGSFELTHRPRDVPLDAENIPIEYVPDNQSAYLGSEATVNVSVEQVEPTITDVTVTEDGAYGDEITFQGNVAAMDEPVDGVPFTVTLAGQPLGTVEASNGSFDGTFELPLTVPAGEQELEVSLEFEDQALAQTTENTSLTVIETETEILVNSSESNDEIRLAGQLVDEDGAGIENETLQIHLEETPLGSVTTGSEGEFNATVDTPAGAEGETVLSVAYDNPETSLERSEAETTIMLPEGGDSVGTPIGAPAWVWIGLGLLGATGLVVGSWWYRRAGSPPGTVPTNGPNNGQEVPSTVAATEPTENATEYLSQARKTLDGNDPDRAVQYGYAAVRQAFRSDVESDRLTHREFVERMTRQRSNGLGEREETLLRDVTTGYERAVFDSERIPRGVAESLLEDAIKLCEGADESGYA
ncbi:hypothetical protein ACLI4Y_08730 [Natrialbaceae archaeon A-CW3]